MVKPEEIEGNYDLTEPAGGWIEGNRCFTLIRPIYWPWMWETWSEDGGKTWGPTKMGTFPGYAPGFLRMKNGVLIFTNRFPYLTGRLSFDNAKTWTEGVRLDWEMGAMSAMLEIDPEHVLIIYCGLGYEDKPRLCAQLLRITSSDILPVV